MKYIRTEDGVYNVSCSEIVDMNTGTVLDKQYQWSKYTHHGDTATVEVKQWCRKDIIAEADTIEELCNEFIIEYEDSHHIVYDEFEWAKDKALRSNKKYIIYGAIWTDKGLIYVAKMNKKGELELI